MIPSTFVTLPYAGLSPLIWYQGLRRVKSKPKGVHLCRFMYILGCKLDPKRLFLECEIEEDLALQIYGDYKNSSISRSSTKKWLFHRNNLGWLNLSVRFTHGCINHIIKSVCKQTSKPRFTNIYKQTRHRAWENSVRSIKPACTSETPCCQVMKLAQRSLISTFWEQPRVLSSSKGC